MWGYTLATTSAMSTQVTQLYVVLFGRAPEAGGLAYWMKQMSEGASFAAIAQQMYDTEAARSAYPIYLSKDQIVSNFYTNVLGRSPDVVGLYYWTGKLAAPGATVGGVVAELCTAIVNYRADDAASAASQALFNNKVAVGLYFGETLQGTNVADASDVLKRVTATDVTAAKAAASYSADPVYKAATDAAAAKAAAEAAAAKAAVDAAAIKAAALIALETANEATAASALTAYNAAKEISDASAVAAAAAAVSGTAAAAAVTSLALANASVTASALAASTAATSVAQAGLTSTAAATLAAAVAATRVTTDDAAALAATAAAASAVATAAAATAAAAAKVVAAAAVAATYASQTFTLSTGADNFAGGLGIDIFNAISTATFNAGDSINGGAGNDTLNVSDNAAAVATAGRSVINVETANLSSSAKVTANTTGWTGLTRLNILADTGDSSVTAATTTAVTVAAHSGGDLTVTGGSSQTVTTSDVSNKTVTLSGANGVVSLTGTLAGTGNLTGGAINVIGGSTITVNETQTQATVNRTTTAGVVSVTGDTSTTSVSVTNSRAVTASGTAAGIANNAVFIEDANWFRPAVADTITSVTISAYSVSQIYSKSVTSLSLANSAGDVVITDFGEIYNRTLALTVDGLTAGTISNTGRYATLNVTTANNASTLSGIDFTALQTLTVAGTKLLTLNSTASLTALKTLTVTGSAGISVNVSSNSAVTAVDTTGTSGTSTITLNADASTFSGGAGVDTVTATGSVNKAISLGAGNDTFVFVAPRGYPTGNINGGDGIDTISMSAILAEVFSSNATFAGKVTGFELLTLTSSTNRTVDLAVLGNYSAVSTSGGTGLTLSNLPSGGTLTLTGAGTAYTVSNADFTGGTNDILNVALTDGSGNAVAFATTGITASDVETVAITTADTQTVPTNPLDTLKLLGDSYKTITVTGNAGLNLTAASTSLTSLDARGISANHLVFTSGALTSAATIRGSANGGDVINAAASTNAVTIIETAGANAITGSATFASTLTGSTGADTIVGGAGKDTIVGGGGADSITGGARADSILLSGTTAQIVNAALGDSGINTATSLQTAELTSLFDVVFGAVAGIKIQLFTSTPAVNLSASNLAGSDDVVNFARGVYDFASGVFTYSALGPDTAMTYDTTVGAGTAFETIILMGYTAAMATAISGGLITLA